MLTGVGDICALFKLGRTAAYELTHRPDFPEPVPISPRYRWWASEVEAFADSLRRNRPDQSAGGSGTRRTPKARTPYPATPPRRITGKVRAARARREAP
jgi:predicted DNA-binding transcriptional regulator AlpA